MSAIERRNKEIKKVILNEALDMPEAQFKTGDTHAPIEVANQLWQYGIINSYMEFEIALRRRSNPDIYFIAAPVEYLAQHLVHPANYILRYPIMSPKNLLSAPKFGLIIEAEGITKAVLQLRDLGFNYLQNLKNLKKTGILYPKEKVHENIIFSS